MFLMRLKKFGKDILLITVALLLAALIIGVVGSLAIGPLYWGACVIGGLIASVLYCAGSRLRQPVITGIVFLLVMAKVAAVFVYREQNAIFSMRVHVADAIIGTILFVAAWIALARYVGKHPSLQAMPRL
jgi:uncharacterized membrane protein YhhN